MPALFPLSSNESVCTLAGLSTTVDGYSTSCRVTSAPLVLSLSLSDMQNQFEDASDDDDGSTTAASHSGGDGAKLLPPKAKKGKGNKKNSSSVNSRAAASLFFSDTTAPRHRYIYAAAFNNPMST